MSDSPVNQTRLVFPLDKTFRGERSAARRESRQLILQTGAEIQPHPQIFIRAAKLIEKTLHARRTEFNRLVIDSSICFRLSAFIQRQVEMRKFFSALPVKTRFGAKEGHLCFVNFLSFHVRLTIHEEAKCAQNANRV